MKRSSLIILAFVGAGILLVIGFIGMVGISQPVTLKSGNCEKTYTYFYVEPFLRDFLQCRYMSPCGTDQWLTIRNTRVEIIQCLCKDRVANKELIISNMKEFLITVYPNKNRDDPLYNNVDYVCDKEARLIYPM